MNEVKLVLRSSEGSVAALTELANRLQEYAFDVLWEKKGYPTSEGYICVSMTVE